MVTVNKRSKHHLITGLQLHILPFNEDCFVELLDIATISKKNLTLTSTLDLPAFCSDIKAELDLLMDDF